MAARVDATIGGAIAARISRTIENRRKTTLENAERNGIVQIVPKTYEGILRDDAFNRLWIQMTLPAVSDGDALRLGRALHSVHDSPEHIEEMQKRPFEERLWGGLQEACARPFRQQAGGDIQRWNEVAGELAEKYSDLKGLTLKYGKKQPGIMIGELLAFFPVPPQDLREELGLG
jgi:hypothetical protein